MNFENWILAAGGRNSHHTYLQETRQRLISKSYRSGLKHQASKGSSGVLRGSAGGCRLSAIREAGTEVPAKRR